MRTEKTVRNFRVTQRWPRFLCGSVLSFCIFAMAMSSESLEQGTAGEADIVKGVIAKYAAAVNSEPLDMNLAAQVWANSPEVSIINPNGEEHGWEEVKREFYQNTMEGLFSQRKLTTRDIVVHVYGDSAWAEFNWHFVARLRKNGSTVEANGRETQIYHKIEPNRWVLVHVHYSGMPGTEQRER